MTEEQKTAMYHACRLAYNWGNEHGGEWHLLLHALREVLCPQHATFILTQEHYQNHPELAEVVRELRKVTGE